MLFKRILIPLDMSQVAESVVERARGIPGFDRAEVVLLHVHPGRQAYAQEFESLSPGHNAAQKLLAEQYLKDVVERLAADNIRARSHLLVAGDEGAAIVEYGAAVGATAILMSTHGRGGVSRWALGSVAEKILQSSSIPVLVVQSYRGRAQKGLDAAPREPLRVRSVIVALDGSIQSMDALPHANEVAAAWHAPVTVIHAYSSDEELAYQRRRMESIRPRVLSSFDEPAKVEFLAPGGDPASRILDLADERPQPLICLTTHGHGGASTAALGSVAARVLRASSCPVLLVRPTPVPKKQ